MFSQRVPVRVNRNGTFDVRAIHRYDGMSDYRVSVSVSTVDRSGRATRPDMPFVGRAATDQSKAVITCPVTVATLRAIASGAPKDERLMKEYAAQLSAAMDRFGIVTQAQQAAFLAEAAQETIGFTHLTELSNGRKYEGRSDLGNTQPGDGPLFKGRGFIQLTGRANYSQASKELFGDDRLVRNPGLVASDPQIAALTAAWFWTHHVGGGGHTPAYHVSGNPSIEGFKRASAEINGWFRNRDGSLRNPNGWTQRQHYYQRALETIFFGIRQSERLVSVSNRGRFNNVVDDGNLNPAHVDLALASVVDALNSFGRGSAVDVWVSRYLGRGRWSDPFDDLAVAREHRQLEIGYPCSAVEVAR
jgi:putative chitinase